MYEEIYFRGKRTDNDEWVKGFYVRLANPYRGCETHRIYSLFAEVDCGDYYPDWFEVDPKTVGVYTTIEDENDKPIYTGDICKGHNILHPDRTVYEVAIDDGMVCLFDEDGVSWHYSHIDNIEVIGNIHDDIELLRHFNYQI